MRILSIKRLIEQARHVHCLAGCAVGDLVTTGSTVGDDDGVLWRGLKRGEEVETGHLKRDIDRFGRMLDRLARQIRRRREETED